MVTETEAELLLQSRLSELEKLQQIEKLTSKMNSLLMLLSEHIGKVQSDWISGKNYK